MSEERKLTLSRGRAATYDKSLTPWTRLAMVHLSRLLHCTEPVRYTSFELSHALGCSERTAKAALEKLVQDGYLRKIAERKGGEACSYCIACEDVKRAA